MARATTDLGLVLAAHLHAGLLRSVSDLGFDASAGKEIGGALLLRVRVLAFGMARAMMLEHLFLSILHGLGVKVGRAGDVVLDNLEVLLV